MLKFKNYLKKSLTKDNLKHQKLSNNYPCLTIHNVVPDKDYIKNHNNIKESFALDLFESIDFKFILTADDGFISDYKFLTKVSNKNIVKRKIFITKNYFTHENIPWWRIVDYLFTEEKYNSKLYKNNKLLSKINIQLKKIYIRNSFDNLDLVFKKILGESIPNILFEKIKSEMLSAESYDYLKKEDIIKVGIHTVNHPKLSLLDFKNQFYEINESLKFMKENFKSFSNDFAIPYGNLSSYNKDTLRISKELNLNCFTNHIKYPFFFNKKIFYRINISDSGDGLLNSQYIRF